MPKFTFIGEHTDLYGKPDGTKITYDFTVDSLSDILIHTDLFVRGCGYNPSGTLDYVPDEEYYGHWETPTVDSQLDEWTQVRREDALAEGGDVNSKYFYDTERNK